MKKFIFLILLFLVSFSVVNADIGDVQFVGGTGGSKIINLDIEDNSINTSGIIYDTEASLVYEISYTNNSNYKKKLVDIVLPNTDVVLNYNFDNIDVDRVVDVGETVTFQYSINSGDLLGQDDLSLLNESYKAQLVFTSVSDIPFNPDTGDIIFVVFGIFILSIVCFIVTKNKKCFYFIFLVTMSCTLFAKLDNVVADDDEIVDINTNTKYIFSNLAPSCANTNYEGDFCIDWKLYGNRDLVHYLVMEDSKIMNDTYSIGDISFKLQEQYDVSEQQNGDVVLGIYKADTDEESYLFLVGQDGGVIVPKDASYQFTSYDKETNNSSNDFKYIKYADFSKFYSNKTTNMSYMLTGIGTVAEIEKIDLSGFETSNVVNMQGMFLGVGEFTKNLEIDVSNFDTSNVTDMSYMFREIGAKSEKIVLDLSGFDTSKVTNMKGMFHTLGVYAGSVDLKIQGFDTSNVTDMSYMFYDYGSIADDLFIDYFKDWDTSNVVDMKSMLGAASISGPVSSWSQYIDVTGLDTENVTDMSNMFGSRFGLKKIIGLDTFDTSKVTNMMMMFYYIDPEKLDIEDWDVSNVTNMMYLFGSINGFEGCVNGGKKLDLSNWDVSNVSNVSGIFDSSKIDFYIAGWNLGTCKGMFSDYGSSTLDLSYMNFENSLSYSRMFATVSNLYPSWKIVEYPSVYDLSGSDWNEEADTKDMFKNVSGSTIYVKDEKAKAFIEKQAPDCTVLVKE